MRQGGGDCLFAGSKELVRSDPERGGREFIPYRDFLEFREHAKSFEGFAAAGGRTYNLTGLREPLRDRRVDLSADQEIEPEHVVRGLAGAPAIDPTAVLKLVAFPRLADGETDEQRDQRAQQGEDGVHREY